MINQSIIAYYYFITKQVVLMADMAMIVVKLAANSVETKHVNKRRALVHTVVWKDTPERIAINVSRFLVFFIMLIFQIHFHLPNLP